MPHVTFVPLTGFRIREAALRELGMTLPGLRQRGAALAQLPALGLLTLAGMLPRHWSASYRPASIVDDELVGSIIAERPDLVAISALTASIEEAYRLSDRLRERGVRTVLGGLHVTACADEALGHADAIVVGHGELSWPRLLADFEQGQLERVYAAHRGEVVETWPVPRFDLLGGRPRRYTLQTQRGCPLACDFCGASRLLGRFQEKPLTAIRRELAAIRTLDERPLLELADDNTFAGSRDAEELLAALEASGARYFTEADWRIGERPELLRRLAASGCVQVLMGIESIVFRYPGMGAKQAELARIMDAVEAIQSHGVAVNGCFIVGADGETQASIDRCVEFILDSPLAEVQLTLQTPFPGTGLRRRLASQGRLLPERSWSSYTLFDVTYQPDFLTVEELEAAFRRMLSAVFAEGPTRRRMEIRRAIWHKHARLRRQERNPL